MAPRRPARRPCGRSGDRGARPLGAPPRRGTAARAGDLGPPVAQRPCPRRVALPGREEVDLAGDSGQEIGEGACPSLAARSDTPISAQGMRLPISTIGCEPLVCLAASLMKSAAALRKTQGRQRPSVKHSQIIAKESAPTAQWSRTRCAAIAHKLLCYPQGVARRVGGDRLEDFISGIVRLREPRRRTVSRRSDERLPELGGVGVQRRSGLHASLGPGHRGLRKGARGSEGLKPQRVVLGGGGVGFFPSIRDMLHWMDDLRGAGAECHIHNIGVAMMHDLSWANSPEVQRVLGALASCSVRDDISSFCMRLWPAQLRPKITLYPERLLPPDPALTSALPPRRRKIGVSVTGQKLMRDALREQPRTGGRRSSNPTATTPSCPSSARSA